ncbi:MAG: glycerol-3-phosphate 1-O-acyltransferase PlsY [Nitrospirae bacterium]|nr:glycerol-3-phosphate 1-O-acyltransferase PlsY [Nitrospirota bacterium]
MTTYIPLIVLSYLIGAIPFGLIIARLKGIDLRKTGSGNIGATNVLRSVGKKEAIVTLLCDILKGMIIPLVVLSMDGQDRYVALTGLAAVLGHDFSIFLRLRGGKGVATSIGAVLVYEPVVGVITISLWLLSTFLFKYSSLSALIAFALLPFNMIIFQTDNIGIIFSLCLTFLIFIKHRANIKRLMEGKEPRIGKK